jgi:hypothetical protein
MRRRIDEWGRIVEQLPPLDRAYHIDFRLLSDRLAEIPDDVNGILKLFDGHRTLAQVLEATDFGGLAAAKALAKLWSEQIIRAAPAPASTAAPPGPPAPPGLPGPHRERESQLGPAEGAEWFRGPVDEPLAPTAPASRHAPGRGLAPAPSLPPRIVRFPAKRREPRPSLQIETTSFHQLPPAGTAERTRRASSGTAPAQRSAPVAIAPGRRSLATALLLAATALAGVGIWRIVTSRPEVSAGSGAPAAAAPAAPLESPAPGSARAPGNSK